MDPEAQIEEYYKTKNDKVFSWKALRLIAKENLGAFSKLGAEDMEAVVPALLGVEPPGKAAAEAEAKAATAAGAETAGAGDAPGPPAGGAGAPAATGAPPRGGAGVTAAWEVKTEGGDDDAMAE